jgi:hypothetical protein
MPGKTPLIDRPKHLPLRAFNALAQHEIRGRREKSKMAIQVRWRRSRQFVLPQLRTLIKRAPWSLRLLTLSAGDESVTARLKLGAPSSRRARAGKPT